MVVGMLQEKNNVTDNHYYSDHLQNKLRLLNSKNGTIIEAPSGYGKTTAVRHYLEDAAADGDDIHWFIAMDEAPAALYRRLCSEIESIDKYAGERLLKIDFPNAFTIGETCDAIISIKCQRNTWFIIDNFHFFSAILPPAFLTALLEHGENDLHVIIIAQPLDSNFISAITGHGILHIKAQDFNWSADDIRLYFKLNGVELTAVEVQEVKRLTEGWVIAVYLQLCSYQETGAFSDGAVLKLMEELIWNKITNKQQNFLMMLSPFESCTINQMCSILGCDTLPNYAADSLSMPFVQYVAKEQAYKPHTALLEFLITKRHEYGIEFENECFRKAGDFYKQEDMIADALYNFAKIKDYERILSLNLSNVIYMEIGDSSFSEIALDIAQNCPIEVAHEYPLSMLCVAWALRLSEEYDSFERLLSELDSSLSKTGLLRAEWLLLSVYQHFPLLDKMLPIVKGAAKMFDGNYSNVILPEAPWAFYEYRQMTAFHARLGAADHEADMLEEFINIYSKLTNGHGNGADALFRAELAYLRFDTSHAEILAHKAAFLAENKHQKIVQAGAAKLLAEIALLKADTDSWQRAVNAIEHAASGSEQNTPMLRTTLDVVYSSLLTQLRDYSRVTDWLKNSDFMHVQLPESVRVNAVSIHTTYLMGQNEPARLIGLLQTMPLDKLTVYAEFLYYFLLAIGFSLLGDRKQALVHLELSAEKSLPDGLIYYFVRFSKLLKGLSEELIEDKYPQFLAQYKECEEQYTSGWRILHNAIVTNELPSDLTGREHEIALLAAEGLRNNEIAAKLFVSENTVRAHLRTIYQKLDIDRRAKLAQKL
ncbi:MAG: LuxR C-terminal-related transcriptional regulator [Oscillospiraceae bacterium]|nr:LuxR C-terminal-related transcriptional regulator [Oscillospiraceae bacterium]